MDEMFPSSRGRASGLRSENEIVEMGRKFINFQNPVAVLAKLIRSGK